MNNDIDWQDIDYLASGNPRQRHTHRFLVESGILSALKKWKPLLTGTVPIDVSVADSDLDILCTVSDLNEFERFLKKQYGDEEGFIVFQFNSSDGPAVVSRFQLGREDLEIFGTNKSTTEQTAFKHMQLEWLLLQILGEDLRSCVKELKRNGVKTEPAFCQCLGVEGDPYKTLLDVSEWTETEIETWATERFQIHRRELRLDRST